MTWQPSTIETPKPQTFTQDEILRYATYHWLGVEGDAHVWRTIGGQCDYLGLANQIPYGNKPPENRPLYPSLTPPDHPSGPTSGAGGPLPYQIPES